MTTLGRRCEIAPHVAHLSRERLDYSGEPGLEVHEDCLAIGHRPLVAQEGREERAQLVIAPVGGDGREHLVEIQVREGVRHRLAARLHSRLGVGEEDAERGQLWEGRRRRRLGGWGVQCSGHDSLRVRRSHQPGRGGQAGLITRGSQSTRQRRALRPAAPGLGPAPEVARSEPAVTGRGQVRVSP